MRPDHLLTSVGLSKTSNYACPLHRTGLDLPLSTDFTATFEKLGNDQEHLYHCTISMAPSTSWKGRMDSSASHQSLHHRSRFDQFTFTLRLPRIAPADDPL
ncbi:hypothetical protein F2Q69_00046756 [Brassica cretica]|uniref:Uncharacterized protein n=1 Tax=Brassica cretica TaxID=69181 RepID=A0A8S9PQN0_BRACR|nr:hypothetical protein F2Q69_00046756 [Brassica cretica]